MSANLNTKIVTTTPYTVLSSDEVIFVNVVGLASIVLPADGEAVGEDCCGNKHDDDTHHDEDHEHDKITGLVIKVVAEIDPKKPESEPDKPKILYRSYYIKDYSGNAAANPITIISAGGKTIDGVKFALINAGYGHIQVVYDGTNWKIIS